MAPIPLEALDAASFQERCGSDFSTETSAGVILLRLEEVRLLGGRREGASRDPFALGFRGPYGIRIEQKIYRLEQDGTAPLEIFLVQVADKPEGSLFEAIFT
jgi:hypothetical protein